MTKRWTFACVLSIILLAVSACAAPKEGKLFPMAVNGQRLDVEVAADDATRRQGLMDRKTLGADRGMLFVFEKEQPLGFWMHNTKVPLSIAFIDDALVVVDIQDMKPMSDDVHNSAKPARYALEVNQGWFKARGIAPGVKVTFSAELQKALNPEAEKK